MKRTACMMRRAVFWLFIDVGLFGGEMGQKEIESKRVSVLKPFCCFWLSFPKANTLVYFSFSFT